MENRGGGNSRFRGEGKQGAPGLEEIETLQCWSKQLGETRALKSLRKQERFGVPRKEERFKCRGGHAEEEETGG